MLGRAEDGFFRAGDEESPGMSGLVAPVISCKAGGHPSAVVWLWLCSFPAPQDRPGAFLQEVKSL